MLAGSRNCGRGEAAAKEIGPGAIALQLDVTDRVSVAEAAGRVRQEFGRLDLLVQNAAISNTRKGSLSVPEYIRISRASNASLDEVRAVWETNVFGVLAFYQAMLPLLRRSPDAQRYRQRVERRGVAGGECEPGPPLSPDVRSHLSGVESGAQRDDARHDGGAGTDRDQGQSGLAGPHQDESQWLCGQGVRRGRLARSGARGPARPGWPIRVRSRVGENVTIPW